MPRYKVEYAHNDDVKSTEETRLTGWGVVVFDRDEPVETNKDLKDVARWIGHEYGYTEVGILSIFETDEGLENE